MTGQFRDVASRFFGLFQKRSFLIILFATFLGFLFFETGLVGKWLYPISYKEDIYLSAENNQVDPLFIAAIIRVESNFKPDNRSKKGAMGMMQLMPDTAKWIVETWSFPAGTLDKLEHVDVNIELGATYINWLYNQFIQNRNMDFDHESELAIISAAYNAGPNRVQQWLNDDIWDGRYSRVDDVPFGETRHYVQRIVYYYNKYKSIYPAELL